MPVPTILGFVLRPILENDFPRFLTLSLGDWSTSLTWPLSLALLMVNLFVLIDPEVFARPRSLT